MSDVVLPGSGDSTAEKTDLAPRPDTLEDARIAFIDWGKPNGEELYESLSELLATEHGAAELEWFQKPSPSSPMPADLEEAVLEYDPDAAILAIADCGSCNSSSVVDNITLEEAGIPTVQVITDEFIELNRQIREGRGYDELPIVTVPHPTRFLDREEVEALAKEILPDLTAQLTDPAEIIA